MVQTCYINFFEIAYNLPDGRQLFGDCNGQIVAEQRIGLVGQNGVGKTLLAKILSQHLMSTSGKVQRQGSIYYLPQNWQTQSRQSIADLTGLKHIFSALQRAEQGFGSQTDFDLAEGHWDLVAKLQAQLSLAKMPELTSYSDISLLSGGQIMRIALIGAFLAQADLLILDEPTNHLDSKQRQWLYQQMASFRGALLVISHDRALLNQMDEIWQLSPTGISKYGGNYDFFVLQQELEKKQAVEQLTKIKLEQKRQDQQFKIHQQKIIQKQNQAGKQAKTVNQAKIILNAQKNRADASIGTLKRKQQQMQQQLVEQRQQVKQSSIAKLQHKTVQLHQSLTEDFANKQVALLENCLTQADTKQQLIGLNLTIDTSMRIAVIGDNGVGKTLLLKSIAGLMPWHKGSSKNYLPCSYVDQLAQVADENLTGIELLQQVDSQTNATQVVTRLIHLGLTRSELGLSFSQLSGGQRLKILLACAIYAQPSVQLLLLDEPTNHLDLTACQAVESLCQQYKGALMVVSHDSHFLQQLELTHYLKHSNTGWQLELV